MNPLAADPVQISVVIVTYNSHRDLVTALPALRAAMQDVRYRICLVDNASTDGTQEFLQRQQQSLPELLLILNDLNRGYTAAVNQGLRRVGNADFVLLLNPDVIIPPTTMPILLQELQQDGRIGLIAPQMRYPNGRIQPSCRRFPRQRDVFLELFPDQWLRTICPRLADWKMTDFDHRSSRWVDQPPGAFFLIRNQALQQVGLLDERFFMFFSDVDYCQRLVRLGWKIRFCADTFVYHQGGSSVNRNKAKMIVTSHRSFVDYFLKYQPGGVQKFGIVVVTVWLLILLLPRLLWARLRANQW